MNGLNISKKQDGNEVLLALTGRIDTATSSSLDSEISSLSDSVSKLTLDFSNVEYISSAGLRVLLTSHKKFESKDGLYIQNINQTVSEVFEITGFDMIFHIL